MIESISTLPVWRTPAFLATQQTNARLATLQAELPAGQSSDLGLARSADTGRLLRLRAEQSALQAFGESNVAASTRLDALQSSLDSIRGALSDVGALLTGPGGTKDSARLQSANALATISDALNGSVAGVRLFPAPHLTDPPLEKLAKQFDADFQTYFGFAVESVQAAGLRAESIGDFLDLELAKPAADAPETFVSSALISPHRSVETGVSSEASALRKSMLTMIATQRLASSAVADNVFTQLKTSLAGRVQESGAALTDMQAEIGARRSRVATQIEANSATLTRLEQAINSIQSIDTYRAAAEINQLTNQVEASYRLTARMQSLNLASYL